MSEPANESAEVRLFLEGEHGTIDVAALHKALGALLDLLKAGGIRANLVISDLREGSAELAVRPRVADVDVEQHFAEIVRGLADLSTEQVGRAWDVPMLESAADLAAALDFTGVTGVRVVTPGAAEAMVTATTLNTAQAALSTSHLSIGSVTGRVHRVIDHKSRREIGLTDVVTGRTVTVTFTQDQEPRLVAAFGKTVEAWGELRRDRDGRKTRLKLDDFTVIEQTSSDGPSIDDLQGVLGADWIKGQNSVDAVRTQRNGD